MYRLDMKRIYKKPSERIGERLGRLVIVSIASCGHNATRFLCKCDCGNIHEAAYSSLMGGSTKSCGCLRREAVASKNYKHGYAGTPTHRAWKGMKDRCYNSRSESYENYGARGITVCSRWRGDFLAFLKDMGPRPFDKSSIDRRNNNGNYEPSNCRWSTPMEQNRNNRRNKLDQATADSIRVMHRNGIRPKRIINALGLSRSVVENVLYNKGAWA